MPILPLPQFELDLEEDRKTYAKLKAPSSIVARFGAMKMVGEFPYDGEAKPGCGSKLVIRTHRGTELGEMLTSTCPNSGCSKSVSRKEMLEYIENSGGREYPFFSHQGKVLRIATVEDLNEQARLEAMRHEMIGVARRFADELGLGQKEGGLGVKVADAEPILGQEKLTFYFNSEERIDFRPLVMKLSEVYHTRIEMRQIGARDEARLVADYERCGQHCCCKQFLKVLKPVSMKSAKVQKATLDPLKISGRCGRLMCCLRYEDQTYTELAARLPRKKTRVNTPEGPGTVLDTQILTQLVLVKLDKDGSEVAITVEELGEGTPPLPPPPPPLKIEYKGGGSAPAGAGARPGPDGRGRPGQPGGQGGGPGGGPSGGQGGGQVGGRGPRPEPGARREDRPRAAPPAASAAGSVPEHGAGGPGAELAAGDGGGDGGGGDGGGVTGEGPSKRKRRRRRSGSGGGGAPENGGAGPQGGPGGPGGLGGPPSGSPGV